LAQRDWDELHRRVLQFTSDLLGSGGEIQPESDPETDDPYFAVHVTSAAEVDEIVKLKDAWHRNLLAAAGSSAHYYRLALHVV
jgi:hypothetical protein